MTPEKSSENKIVVETVAASDARIAFKIRHDAYFHDGLIERAADGMYSDAYDFKPTTIILLAHAGGVSVGTMRLCFSPGPDYLDSMPCQKVYPEARELRHSTHDPIVEFSRLAVSPQVINLSVKTTVYAALINKSRQIIEGYRITALVAAQSKSLPFYRRILNAEIASMPRRYPPGNIDITLMKFCPRDTVAGRQWNSFFGRTPVSGRSDPSDNSQLKALLSAAAVQPAAAE